MTYNCTSTTCVTLSLFLKVFAGWECAMLMYLVLVAAGLTRGVIIRIGKDKVVQLVTDNAANMALHRKLVVETEGFTHIEPTRCELPRC